MTWEGQNYLESVRDNTRWGKIKKIAKEKGIPLMFKKSVGILGYLIAEMKTPRYTNKQKYRLRLSNFSALRRREIFIFCKNFSQKIVPF